MNFNFAVPIFCDFSHVFNIEFNGDSMIEFSLGRVRITLSFTFFALIAVLTASNFFPTAEIITALLCCILHELGHITAMCLFGVPPEEIMFYAGGIKITPDRGKIVSRKAEAVILVGGCGVNFLMFALSFLVNGRVGYFACTNLFLGIFNLMPLKYFDGGRIASVFLSGKAEKIVRTATFSILALLLIIMLYFGKASLSLFVTLCYILLCEICPHC